MSFIQYLCTACLVFTLTGCLKVTGEAKDQFDEEDDEQSLGLLNRINPFDKPEASAPAQNTAEEVTARPNGVERATVESPPINPQELAEFQKWKNERDSGSSEYQEFQEFLEYKKWLELQEAKDQ